MYAVPVLSGGHGHSGDGEELVQLVECSRQSTPAGGNNAGAHLHGFIKPGAVEESGNEGHQGSVGRGEVHGAAHHQPVAGREFGGGLIDQIVENAFAGFAAFAAADAAADVFVAHVDDFGFHTLLLEDFFHLMEGRSGVTVDPGTAVDHQYLHYGYPFYV